MLRLRRDDILLVALTIPNCRNGSVCPAEIKRFQKNGDMGRRSRSEKRFPFFSGCALSSKIKRTKLLR
jgi:hypothetical protein